MREHYSSAVCCVCSGWNCHHAGKHLYCLAHWPGSVNYTVRPDAETVIQKIFDDYGDALQALADGDG